MTSRRTPTSNPTIDEEPEEHGLWSSPRRLALILEGIADGVTAQDRAGHLIYANPAAARLSGYETPEAMLAASPEDFVRRFEILDDAGRPFPLDRLPGRRALAGEDAAETTLRYRDRRTGEERWSVVRAQPIMDEEGQVRLAISIFRDVTASVLQQRALEETAAELEIAVSDLGARTEEAERAHARIQAVLEGVGRAEAERERTEKRLRVLAEAGKVLAASLDYETSLRSVTGLLVPEWADWCFVDLATPAGFRRLAVANADPTQAAAARALEREYSATRVASIGVLEVIRSGHSQLVPEIRPEQLPTLARDEEHLAMMRSLGLYSAIIVALVARGKTLGALSLIRSTPARGRFSEDDLVFAEELGRRTALAADNALLYREAVKANEAKSDFLAVMSHELRTPLAAIIGYAELIGDEIVGPLNDAQKEQLSRVRASGAHLSMLIEEILGFARIEAGQETVRRERIEMVELVRETVGIVEPMAGRKGIRLGHHLPSSPLPTETDGVKVRQILLNLLANAIRFTEQGTVTVSLQREGDVLDLAVHDTGIGIAAEHLATIFEPFWQVEQVRTRKTGGTGLGLSVARQLARLLGGDVTAESEVGKGSVFRCRLPNK
jgi:PAS domain S-box-containing protein